MHDEAVVRVIILLDEDQFVLWSQRYFLNYILEAIRSFEDMDPLNSKDFAEKVVDFEFFVQLLFPLLVEWL